jgi:hypothetical protein
LIEALALALQSFSQPTRPATIVPTHTATSACRALTATSNQDPNKSVPHPSVCSRPPRPSPRSGCLQSVDIRRQCDLAVRCNGEGHGKLQLCRHLVTGDGTIASSGLFTAPATAGTATVTATSVQDTARSGEATLTVQSQTPQSKHIVMVVEENQSYASVVCGRDQATSSDRNCI